MDVFHYSRIESWPRILEVDKQLCASQMVAGRPRIHALTDPIPNSWANNKEFPFAWKQLRDCVGNLLLRIDVDGLEDDIQVADWAYLETVLRGGYSYRDKLHAEQAYENTVISFADFLANPTRICLPEILLPSSIAINRVHVHSEQPFLQERLQNWTGMPRSKLLSYMSSVPELNGSQFIIPTVLEPSL